MIAKVLTIVLWVLGIVAWVSPVLGPATTFFAYLAVVLLVAHTLEIFIALPHLKKYPGGLAQSILLCLVFGVIHWMPLRKLEQA